MEPAKKDSRSPISRPHFDLTSLGILSMWLRLTLTLTFCHYLSLFTLYTSRCPSINNADIVKTGKKLGNFYREQVIAYFLFSESLRTVNLTVGLPIMEAKDLWTLNLQCQHGGRKENGFRKVVWRSRRDQSFAGNNIWKVSLWGSQIRPLRPTLKAVCQHLPFQPFSLLFLLKNQER